MAHELICFLLIEKSDKSSTGRSSQVLDLDVLPVDSVKSIREDINRDCCVGVGDSLGSITVSAVKSCCCVNSSL